MFSKGFVCHTCKYVCLILVDKFFSHFPTASHFSIFSLRHIFPFERKSVKMVRFCLRKFHLSMRCIICLCLEEHSTCFSICNLYSYVRFSFNFCSKFHDSTLKFEHVCLFFWFSIKVYKPQTFENRPHLYIVNHHCKEIMLCSVIPGL